MSVYIPTNVLPARASPSPSQHLKKLLRSEVKYLFQKYQNVFIYVICINKLGKRLIPMIGTEQNILLQTW